LQRFGYAELLIIHTEKEKHFKMYDFVVVGAGFFRAIFAHEVKKAGKKFLVIEKRDHIGGNCYSYDDSETRINIQKYGPHIFHTSDKNIWDYINAFADYNDYRHRMLIKACGTVSSFIKRLDALHFLTEGVVVTTFLAFLNLSLVTIFLRPAMVLMP
jgi:UDP-galactopyranose mutase